MKGAADDGAVSAASAFLRLTIADTSHKDMKASAPTGVAAAHAKLAAKDATSAARLLVDVVKAKTVAVAFTVAKDVSVSRSVAYLTMFICNLQVCSRGCAISAGGVRVAGSSVPDVPVVAMRSRGDACVLQPSRRGVPSLLLAVHVCCQTLAFPLSSYTILPWSSQNLMNPVARTLGALSALDVGDQLTLTLFVTALAWIASVVSVAVFVAMHYTRNRFATCYAVKVMWTLVWSGSGQG